MAMNARQNWLSGGPLVGRESMHNKTHCISAPRSFTESMLEKMLPPPSLAHKQPRYRRI